MALLRDDAMIYKNREVKFVQWWEPCPIFGDRMTRVTPKNAIAAHRKAHPGVEMTDLEAFEDFIIVNWAEVIYA
jgi:hypothetical protein